MLPAALLEILPQVFLLSFAKKKKKSEQLLTNNGPCLHDFKVTGEKKKQQRKLTFAFLSSKNQNQQ